MRIECVIALKHHECEITVNVKRYEETLFSRIGLLNTIFKIIS